MNKYYEYNNPNTCVYCGKMEKPCTPEGEMTTEHWFGIDNEGYKICDDCAGGQPQEEICGEWKFLPVSKKKCLRCDYQWYPKSPKEPQRCPNCNSPYWNRPRIKAAPEAAKVKRNNRYIAASLRRQIIDKYESTCYYCQNKTENPIIDHLLPIWNGGSDQPDNLIISCRRCNSSRGNRTPEEMIQYTKERGWLPGMTEINLNKWHRKFDLKK